MVTLLRRMLHLLFPPKCIFCRKLLTLGVEQEHCVCKECEQKLPYTVAQLRCKSCGRPIRGGRVHCELCRKHPSRPFMKISSAYLYRGVVKGSIVRFKKETYRGYAQVFARHMEAVIAYDCPDVVFDVMVSVPPRKRRMKKDGYDQAEALAKALSVRMKLPYLAHILAQKEERKKQSALTSAERWSNAEGNVTVLHPERIVGKRVLLVDDVCTTGATLFAAALALRTAGAKAVYCATAATAEKV